MMYSIVDTIPMIILIVRILFLSAYVREEFLWMNHGICIEGNLADP